MCKRWVASSGIIILVCVHMFLNALSSDYVIKRSIVWFSIPFFLSMLVLVNYRLWTNMRQRLTKERVLSATLNATDDGILIVNNERQVIETNHVFINMWSIPEDLNNLRDEIKMIKYVKKQLLDPDGFEQWIDYMYEAAVTGHYKADFVDGRACSIYSSPLMDKEDAVGRVWSFRDISESKKSEELKKKMEDNMRLLNETIEYDKLKTEFFANISHEFRTPLNIILGSLQLMELIPKDLNSKDKEYKLNRYTQIMKQNCFRLLRLLNNFIDITKIDSGFMELHMQNHDLAAIVKNMMLSVARFVEDKGIRIDCKSDIDELVTACDLDKIERIILNLISNAAKFSKPRGSIHVSLYKEGENACISVKDSGVGISEDKREVIFERFHQVDKSFTRICEGSGIGLSLVKSLVEMHGGTIEVISAEGEGSEFIVRLPIRTVEHQEWIAVMEEMAPSREEKINIEFSDIYF